VAKNQSKTLTPKNKNKIFPKFLSPYSTSSYKNPASKIETFFGSKLSTPLIIEAVFLLPEFTHSLSPGAKLESQITNNQSSLIDNQSKRPSTTVEIALQIHSILTNKANFMRFSPENDDLTKNKPNSNPIYRKAKNDAKYLYTKDYEENRGYGPKKTNPIS